MSTEDTPRTDAEAVISTALAAAKPATLDADADYSVIVPEGALLARFSGEEYAAYPRRKRGLFHLEDEASFIAYVQRHSDLGTEAWASEPNTRIVAVLDGHSTAAAGWQQHRAALTLRHSPGWSAWLGSNRKMLSQSDFSEHVEDRIVDFVEPDGATMLELAQSFQASSKGRFESSKRLASGETTLEWREEVDAKAGHKGALTIPDSFTLGLVPFVGGPAYKVTARLRYRIADGVLRLGYVLDRPEDVHAQAFTELVERVAGAIAAPVFAGSPTT